VERLREAGLSDRDILDVVGTVALFSYFNVIADALGVEPEPEWAS
jgi:alkylhydroperoxidase family enzyme